MCELHLEMFWLLVASALVGCYGNIISLEGSEGEFENYNYPAPSPANESTTWRITVPPGQSIKLSFIDLSMDWCGDYICFDCTVLKVMEVKENGDIKELSTFCSASSHYLEPKPIISKTRRVHVTLRVPMRDENRDKAKVKARYQAVSSGSSDILIMILSITGILLVLILIASLAYFYCRPSSFTKRTIAERALIGIKPRSCYLVEAPKEHCQGSGTVLPGPSVYVTEKSSRVTVDGTPTDYVDDPATS